ncbi:MAG: hypothetical protein K2X57_11795 [Xanthobacteraceae bacterium]|nr:hypothetical protein [Xanthobacteraceae bacterium]
MSADDNQDEARRFRKSPTGPSVAAPRMPATPLASAPVKAPRFRPSYWSIAVFVLLASGIGIRAWRDLSRPDAWDYWKDQYIAPSMTASLIGKVELGGTGPTRRALQVSGTIGPAAATLLRDRLNEAGLAAGDLILLSSPGGDLNQAVIMGEMIRSRGLATAVGTADGSGRVKPGYCASACVLVYAGGKPRFGVLGSALGVHRFVTTKATSDPVADTQRIAGAVLGYMTKMGVSSSVVEAMSETREIRWLSPQQALSMNLVTDPVGKP